MSAAPVNSLIVVYLYICLFTQMPISVRRMRRQKLLTMSSAGNLPTLTVTPSWTRKNSQTFSIPKMCRICETLWYRFSLKIRGMFRRSFYADLIFVVTIWWRMLFFISHKTDIWHQSSCSCHAAAMYCNLCWLMIDSCTHHVQASSAYLPIFYDIVATLLCNVSGICWPLYPVCWQMCAFLLCLSGTVCCHPRCCYVPLLLLYTPS